MIFFHSFNLSIHHANTVMHPVHASVQARPHRRSSHETSPRHVSSGHVSFLDHEPQVPLTLAFASLSRLGYPTAPRPHGTRGGKGPAKPKKARGVRLDGKRVHARGHCGWLHIPLEGVRLDTTPVATVNSHGVYKPPSMSILLKGTNLVAI